MNWLQQSLMEDEEEREACSCEQQNECGWLMACEDDRVAPNNKKFKYVVGSGLK
jgi:hypothetical protein